MLTPFKFLSFKPKVLLFFILVLTVSVNAYGKQNDSKFRKVEATGRAILIDGNLEVSRKRAIEDALYIAALKGGAKVRGFSAIGADTIINEQSVVRAASKVIDFKIIKETQDKEFISIKISAIVGNNLLSQNCKIRPINISLFKGHIKVDSNVPSNLARKMPMWFDNFYEIITNSPNVAALDYRTKSIERVIKSQKNATFNYTALTNGIPYVQAGDYSLVPHLSLTKNNSETGLYSNFIIKTTFKIYKGSSFKLLPLKNYNYSFNYNVDSKFQFLRNVSTLNTIEIDKSLKLHLGDVAKKFFKDLYCRPLEGKLSFINSELSVDLGYKQGLKEKQIGIVRGLKIKNSMLSDSSVILHAENINENKSKLLPLNDNIKLESLHNLTIEFVE